MTERVTRPMLGGPMSFLRFATLEDLPALFESTEACLRDGRGMVEGPGECSLEAYTEQMAVYVAPNVPGSSALFVVEVGGLARGHVMVRRLRPSYVRHVGVLGLEVHPEAQGKGHGRALVQRAISWSRKVGVERLELSVRADNPRAIGLYEACGFVRESCRPRFVKLPDGAYVDDFTFAMRL